MLDAPPGAGPLETLLGDVAMRAFDFAQSDRQSLGQRLSIVQLVLAAAQITMASAHRRLFVVDFRRFAMTDERPQCHLETPVSERVLLRLDPGFPRGGVGRDRFGGGAQILANMIEIDQVAEKANSASSLKSAPVISFVLPNHLRQSLLRIELNCTPPPVWPSPESAHKPPPPERARGGPATCIWARIWTTCRARRASRPSAAGYTIRLPPECPAEPGMRLRKRRSRAAFEAAGFGLQPRTSEADRMRKTEKITGRN